jgi:hypothetical protein
MKRVLTAAILLSLILSGCYLITEQSVTPTVVSTSTPVEHPAVTQTSAPVLTGTASQTAAATATVAKTLTLSKTLTPALTRTATKTLTPTKTFTPTKTLAPTQTSTTTPYTLQVEAPVYIKNFVHMDAGCDWLGVAGQVFGEDDSPVLNLVLVVTGKLDRVTLNLSAVTGIPEADVYGPGGYEIQLADEALASSQKLSIQVFDLQGNALSEAYVFDTYADCAKNLAIINFKAQ